MALSRHPPVLLGADSVRVHCHLLHWTQFALFSLARFVPFSSPLRAFKEPVALSLTPFGLSRKHPRETAIPIMITEKTRLLLLPKTPIQISSSSSSFSSSDLYENDLADDTDTARLLSHCYFYRWRGILRGIMGRVVGVTLGLAAMTTMVCWQLHHFQQHNSSSLIRTKRGQPYYYHHQGDAVGSQRLATRWEQERSAHLGLDPFILNLLRREQNHKHEEEDSTDEKEEEEEEEENETIYPNNDQLQSNNPCHLETLDERLLRVPSFSSLRRTPAPPQLEFHLVNVLYATVHTLRLFHGVTNATQPDVAGNAALTLTEASSVLSNNAQFETLAHVLTACCFHSSPSSSGRDGATTCAPWYVVAQDVALLCRQGHRYVGRCLLEAIDIVKAGMQVTQQTSGNDTKETPKASANDDTNQTDAVSLRHVQKKLEFFLSWSQQDTVRANCESLADDIEQWIADWNLSNVSE